MDQFYIILISVLAVAVLLLVFVLKPDLAKKYWAYAAAGIAAIGGLVFLISQKKQVAAPDPEMEKKEQQLSTDLQQVHAEAETTIQVARQQEAAVNTEVEEIKQISDDEERLKRLSDLFNRTRRR